MDNLCSNLNNMNLYDNPDSETELKIQINNDLDKLVNYYFIWNKNRGDFCLGSVYKPIICINNNEKDGKFKINQFKHYLIDNNNGINMFISKIYEKIYENNISEKINLDLVHYLYNYYYNTVFYNMYNKF